MLYDEREIPKLTKQQLKVQNEILRSLGRSVKNVRTNYIDFARPMGIRVCDSIRRELDSPAISDIVDSSDCEDS